MGGNGQNGNGQNWNGQNGNGQNGNGQNNAPNGGNGYYDGGYGQNNVQTSGMRCPKCGSFNCQILTDTTTKGKDFSGSKGCLGALCFGPIGILCGACGKGKQMKTKHFYFCPNCGNKFQI